MTSLLPIALLVLLAASSAVSKDPPDWGEFGEVCLVGEKPVYNPVRSAQVPWYTIDLDLPPHERWRFVAKTYGAKMRTALGTVKTMVSLVGDGILWEFLLSIMEGVPDRMNEPYRSELTAMAEMAELPIGELALMNLFYEVSKGCTSVVAENDKGQIFHGRNLDFGTFFLWDTKAHTWELSNALRDLVVNLQFVRDGRLLFKAVTFAGHLGLLTGLRPGGYTLSTNTRFGSTLGNLITFFTHGLGDKQFLLYANRDMMTECETYEEALHYMETVPLLARGYLIMGGPKRGQGVVLTRSYNGSDHEAFIDTSKPNGWYVLETNYDWDKPVLYLDDRRAPGNDCMQRLGKSNVNLDGLFQVLSSKPTLNKATVYTSVMQVEAGILQTVIQQCEDPCWFV